MSRFVYADNAATTPVSREVIDAMLPCFESEWGNPSSPHSMGISAKDMLDDARSRIANVLGCTAGEIYFTSCGTESDNWALKGAAFARKNKGNHIIISAIEHHAVLVSAEWLAKQGFKVTLLQPDETGLISVSELQKHIDDQTILVSIMHANNEVGTINPIKELAKVAHDHGALFHADCVQSVPYMRVDVKDLGVDLLTFSAHKFYGPKGIGALYIRNGLKIDKLVSGGGQERSQRGGTSNTPAIVGMAKALEIAVSQMDQNNAHIATLRDHFVDRVLAEIPYVRFNGNPDSRVPSIANFSFEFVEGEGILMLLDLAGVAVSSGSACSSGSLDPSHVLLAMGVPIEISHGSIRFSFGKYNTMEEVDYAVDKLKDTIARLRQMSPLFNVKIGGTYNV